MNKLRLTVEAVVLDPRRGILLVKQGRTRHEWELPGGKVKRDESLTDALLRETLEETSMHVKAEILLGVYFVPEQQFCDFVFLCHPVRKTDEPYPNPPEIAESSFFPLSELPSPMRPFTRRCVQDAIHGRVQSLPINLTPAQWFG